MYGLGTLNAVNQPHFTPAIGCIVLVLAILSLMSLAGSDKADKKIQASDV